MNSQSIKNYINVFQSIVILLSWSRSLFCFDYFLTSLFYFPDQVHYEGITLVIILRASKLHMNTWSITYKNVNLKKRNKKTSKQKQKKYLSCCKNRCTMLFLLFLHNTWKVIIYGAFSVPYFSDFDNLES